MLPAGHELMANGASGSGRDISAIFMELPDRKDIPDYYRTIKNPISLEEIEVCLPSQSPK